MTVTDVTISTERRCAACTHRREDRQSLERDIPGLTAFGSGFGASVAASRLCTVHDRLVSPDDVCGQFAPIEKTAAA